MLRKIGLRCLQLCTKPLCFRPTMRLFSDANKQVAKATPKPADVLIQTLNEEYNLETEKYGGFAEGEEFIKGSGFVLTDNKDTTEIRLSRNVGDKLVEIIFQASEAFNDEDDSEMDGKEEDEEQDMEEEGAKSRAEFFVTIKGKGGKGLLFACASENAELQIYNVTYGNDVDALLKDNNNGKQESVYVGPNFDNLDEKVQNAFYDYLESLGISDKLLAYIECASVDKEQKMYMNWLQEMKLFISESKDQEAS